MERNTYAIDDEEFQYDCYNCGNKMITTYGSEVKIKCPKCGHKIEV